MIYELALGLAPPVEIAVYYGFTDDDYTRLAAMPSFQHALAEAKEELEKDGFVRETKLKLMADQLLAKTFQDGMNAQTSPALRLDITKNFATWAGLNKQSTLPGNQTGLSIQINIPGQQTINLTPKQESIEGNGVFKDVTSIDMPGFNLSLDLIGEPIPSVPD